MAGFAEDDNLASEALHLVVALADTLLEGQDDGAGGVDEAYAEPLGGAVGLGRFTVGADEHLAACQLGQTGMVDDHQAQAAETFHLGAVVHDVAQAVEAAVARKFLFRSADGLHHPETIACILVDPNLHNS